MLSELLSFDPILTDEFRFVSFPRNNDALNSTAEKSFRFSINICAG